MTTEPTLFPTVRHEVYMRQLADRISWLTRRPDQVVGTVRRHWWLRSIDEHQATCPWCPRCDWEPGMAA